MKKNFFKVLFVLIVIFSLGLNILLLYEKMNNKEDNVETIEKIEPSTKKDDNKDISYTKKELEKLFKDYQVTESIANSDDAVIFNVNKITYVGNFKSNSKKKLYYIEEIYNCIEGTDCVKPVGKVTIDNETNNITTFVVAVTPVDKTNAKFEILDYSIEENEDFQKAKHVELK